MFASEETQEETRGRRGATWGRDSVGRNMERAEDEARAMAGDLPVPDGIPETSESLSQSFVVKVWIEETAAEVGRTTWRGHITHVGTRTRRYIERLGEISVFIAPYLQALGVDTETGLPRETSEGDE